MDEKNQRWKGVKSFLTWGMTLMAVNIVLLAFDDGETSDRISTYLSILCWVLAVTMWILALVELKRKGGSSKTQNYMQTSRVVDTGIFRIVRHPQYLADILFNVGIMLSVQNWIVITIGILSCVFLYFGMKEEEGLLVKIFGNDYRAYMKRVPRINVLKILFK